MCFRIKKINVKVALGLIIGGVFFSFSGILDWMSVLIQPYLPPTYASYLDSDFNRSNEFVKLLTKMVFVPVYLLSVQVLTRMGVDEKDKWLYNIGIWAYVVRLCFLENFIFNRVGQLFLLLSILPIYVYMKYLYVHKRRMFCYALALLFLLFYSLKTVLLPKGEYLYQSIYF